MTEQEYDTLKEEYEDQANLMSKQDLMDFYVSTRLEEDN